MRAPDGEERHPRGPFVVRNLDRIDGRVLNERACIDHVCDLRRRYVLALPAIRIPQSTHEVVVAVLRAKEIPGSIPEIAVLECTLD